MTQRKKISQRRFGNRKQMIETIYLNPFQNKPWFVCVCSTSLLKTLWEKEKLLVTSNFSFSHSVLYSFGELPAVLIKDEIVRPQTLSVWKSLKFVVWERVNNISSVNADVKTNVSFLIGLVSEREQNIVKTKHNADDYNFPLFPHHFQNPSSLRLLMTSFYGEKERSFETLCVEW